MGASNADLTKEKAPAQSNPLKSLIGHDLSSVGEINADHDMRKRTRLNDEIVSSDEESDPGGQRGALTASPRFGENATKIHREIKGTETDVEGTYKCIINQG